MAPRKTEKKSSPGVNSGKPIVQQAVAQLPSGYMTLLDDIKVRVRAAQLKAGLAVNRELVLLYWHIGREILKRQKQEGWGAKVVDRLSRDLVREFPEVTGFSSRNLLFMRSFAAEYADEAKVKQLVSQLPWGHIVRLMQMVTNPAEREWYVRADRQSASSSARPKTSLWLNTHCGTCESQSAWPSGRRGSPAASRVN